MDINQINKAYAEQYAKDHNLEERYKEAMKQEPVAWNEEELRNACRNARLTEEDFLRIKAYLPVNTAPRELSDEEIKAIANNLTCTPDKNWNVLFAREILKKASEK